MKNRRAGSRLAAVLLISVWTGHASESMAHDESKNEAAKSRETAADDHEQRLSEITLDYQLTVAPLMQRACADCHTSDTQYPWYSMVPGIGQWIRQDIAAARKSIEFSNGYPFQSHATPLEDLIAVEKVVQDGSMPPLRYRIMHGKARLSELEKKRIIDWSRRGQKLLRNDMVGAADAP